MNSKQLLLQPCLLHADHGHASKPLTGRWNLGCAQVRVAAAQQLAGIARSLGEEGLRQKLLGELEELLGDEEVQVRCGVLC